MTVDPDTREAARIVGTRAGCDHARAHGRDDWNADDLAAAQEAERVYLWTHTPTVRLAGQVELIP